MPLGGRAASDQDVLYPRLEVLGGGGGTSSPAPARGADPADRSDKGPSDWKRDPIVWFTAAFALGSGIIGFRFHWGPGAKASASVDVADELASIIGQVFLAIAGLAAFKMIAARIAKTFDAPSLIEFADFL